MESRIQNFREVRLALEKRQQSKVKSRQKGNNKIVKESAGTVAQTANLVLAKKNGQQHRPNGLVVISNTQA